VYIHFQPFLAQRTRVNFISLKYDSFFDPADNLFLSFLFLFTLIALLRRVLPNALWIVKKIWDAFLDGATTEQQQRQQQR
jgi:hypothetical protein